MQSIVNTRSESKRKLDGTHREASNRTLGSRRIKTSLQKKYVRKISIMPKYNKTFAEELGCHQINDLISNHFFSKAMQEQI